jgi:hypothetical protein
MKLARWTCGVLLLGASVAVSLTDNELLLVIALSAGLVMYALARKNLSKSLYATLPVVVFAAVLSLSQVLARIPVTSLAAKSLTIFLFTSAAFRILPWQSSLAAVHPGTSSFKVALYILFIRHFFTILSSEALRLVRARGLSISRPYGKGSFRSLVGALATFFNRSVIRAERFYAAQLLRGLAE